MDTVDKLFSLIERQRETYNLLLGTERKHSSGSGEGPKRALDWISEKLRKAGALIEPLESSSNSPPVLRAVLGKLRDKKTILVYAHLNARCRDTESNKLFGNGLKDSKGPLLCLFAALDTFKELKMQLPVNLIFLFEAMEEKDADKFREFLERMSGTIFTGVDYITVLDNRPNCFYGIKPLLCKALRGCSKFEVKIDCASKNLNSGFDGGAIQEGMTDMIDLFSTFLNKKGDILITGINKDIEPLSPEEEQEYHKATFDVARYKSYTGANELLHKGDKKRVLMHMTRFPSLSINGIKQGDLSPDGDIPSSVIGTFTLRTVPNQSPKFVEECVVDHINEVAASMSIANRVNITVTASYPPWEVNTRDPNIQACLKALKRTYKDDAELVREGGTIPILCDLQEISGKTILLLPIGRAKCHSPNVTESTVFLEGTKTICAYFYEISKG